MFILGEIIGWEFLLVLALIALLFGSSKLPKLARSMGQAKSELEKGMREGADKSEGADKKDDPAES
jgi:sec-independent protein translocase protein TatA